MMKRVKFDPGAERQSASIMEEFDQNNGPQSGNHSPSPIRSRTGFEGESEDVSEDELRARVIEALKTVYDPEIPVNIYDLGLIYSVSFHGAFVHVDMTLTAPGCPVAHTFPGMVERSVELVPGVSGAVVELVWEPPWTPDLISEAARLELGLI